MYGTLSFDKNEDNSSTEFYAFSSIRGRRQRQPACDECRRARVKCREKFSKDKCARCHSTRRACTYSSNQHISRQSNQAGKDGPSILTRPAKVIEEKRVQDGGSHRAINPTPPRALSPTPSEQDDFVGRENIFDFQLDNFDLLGSLSASPSTAATSREIATRQVEVGLDQMGNLFGSINNAFVTRHIPDTISTPTYVDESSIDNRSLSDQTLAAASSSSAPRTSRSTPYGQDGRAKALEPPLEIHQAESTQDQLPDRLSPLAGFRDVIDVMRLSQSPSQSDSATCFPNLCTCLQDLTAGLFSLQTSGENIRVDCLLLLFKRCICKWKGVDTCASACSTSPSLALLLLMNVQQLVSLLLRASSSARTGDVAKEPGLLGSALNINMGSFAVEDRADRRFITQHLITSRMKELSSFISKTSLKVNASGLDIVYEGYQRQMERLRQAFT
ncbi:hypothetical protein CKAH01_13068 [Colletotrichum kahawae]|uniref:Zn(2)-C6 fungal-type domain-containing protein n=1 Tax=Colletotrichum kahawae TaxID=34407 RepID=A0AAD9YP79_COLKA|nr:hypothetical protein CKAH01_13068 [Colletotrichum kahawae]